MFPHAPAIRTGTAGHEGPKVDDQADVGWPVLDVLLKDGCDFRLITHFGVKPLHQPGEASVAADAVIKRF